MHPVDWRSCLSIDSINGCTLTDDGRMRVVQEVDDIALSLVGRSAHETNEIGGSGCKRPISTFQTTEEFQDPLSHVMSRIAPSLGDFSAKLRIVSYMSWRHQTWSHLAVVIGYLAIALVFSWPLALHLGTAFTGPPDGDTGVYVWNQWVFRHEILEHSRLPYFTDSIFAAGPTANLSLHNYTTFQDLLALPLSGLLGVVVTFNVIFLLMSVLTAYATCLLAKQVTGRWAESWLAGALFAWSPLLVTRGMGHFSLVAAAPLAVFLFVLMRADGHERFRDAVMLGVVVAWAASTDVYYAIYCLMIGAVFLIARVLAIHSSPHAGKGVAIRWAFDVLLLCVAGIVGAIALTGGWTAAVMGMTVSARSLYTPMLVLTLLVLVRVAWRLRASFKSDAHIEGWHLARLSVSAALVATVLLSPVLYALSVRATTGDLPTPDILWRSSPGGVDVLALLVPNPNHPLAPEWISDWLRSFPNGFIENVVSIPGCAILTIVVAWRMGWRASRWWVALAVAFGVLALGPFVHIAGTNTYIPGPWAFLRYVPVVGLARTPARFSVVMMLAVAVLFATALEWIGRRYPRQRRRVLGAVAVLVLAELLPAPMAMHSAEVPRFYRHIAMAPDDVRVLELPTGVSDGTVSVGRFSARYQYYQTAHEKSLFGGYLSRVSEQRVSELRRNGVLDGLLLLSDGGTLPTGRADRLIADAPAFVRNEKLGFVVIDRTRASKALVDFAVSAFRLELVEADGRLELYRPRVAAASTP
jgi:hypothetical protein